MGAQEETAFRMGGPLRTAPVVGRSVVINILVSINEDTLHQARLLLDSR